MAGGHPAAGHANAGTHASPGADAKAGGFDSRLRPSSPERRPFPCNGVLMGRHDQSDPVLDSMEMDGRCLQVHTLVGPQGQEPQEGQEPQAERQSRGAVGRARLVRSPFRRRKRGSD